MIPLSHLPSKTVVVKSSYETLYSALSQALVILGLPHLDSGARIVIKINLCDARTPETGAITDPGSLDVLLRILREHYGYEHVITVVECDATVARPDLFINWFGFMPILRKWRVSYVNLSKDVSVARTIDGRFFKTISVPNTMVEARLVINLSKLKTHSLTKISCALKNQYGCLPYRRKIVFHRKIDDVIVDVNLTMKSDLCIVDGIIAHVSSKGPAFGKPIKAGILIIGNDPVAVDSTCARIMGFFPRLIGHIRKAAASGLGKMRNSEIILVGFSRLPRIASEFSLSEYLFIKTIRFIGRVRKAG
jgi:uncharacterized protein (DUF362 family)